MNKGIEIARGKTKVLYEYPGQPDQLVVAQTDQISAGDGARRSEIAGKGRLAAQTTARVFRLLNLCGLPTHYLNGGEDDDDNEMVVRRCNMIPLEVVTRGVAAGSFVKRNPSVQRGMLLVPRVTEFFLKDDARHDPMISPDDIVAQGIANPHEVAAMNEMGRLTFDILAHAWRKRDVLLVDMKIEFGRLASGENQGSLVIADVIDNDAWRIWPQGREDLMLDKQIYRNLQTVDDEALADV
ncbi:MAG TPA: phosphoribosylaminoimidazolesuccinocarboxamide synthase, partial [Candidatus Baltobacteraceae bacterium]|nr:phosphoribosylaminoimidazolesuccinocarboxamide synthase [Candidatus Baltobacteraceae bacterium]